MSQANSEGRPDLLSELQARFPDSESVFTLCDIAHALTLSYETVRRAQQSLLQRASTRELVMALDDAEPQHFSPRGARLIARQSLRPSTRELRELRALQSSKHNPKQSPKRGGEISGGQSISKTLSKH